MNEAHALPPGTEFDGLRAILRKHRTRKDRHKSFRQCRSGCGYITQARDQICRECKRGSKP